MIDHSIDQDKPTKKKIVANIDQKINDQFNQLCKLKGFTKSEVLESIIGDFVFCFKESYEFEERYGVYNYIAGRQQRYFCFSANDAIDIVNYCNSDRGFICCYEIVERPTLFNSRDVSLHELNKLVNKSLETDVKKTKRSKGWDEER